MKTQCADLRITEHASCFVCGNHNRQGMHLEVHKKLDGSVEAAFECASHLEGYKGVLHGGIISLLLDGVMTNCLFLHGIKAMTAELKIRYLHPVSPNESIMLRASIERSIGGIHVVNAKLLQDERVMAASSARFVRTA